MKNGTRITAPLLMRAHIGKIDAAVDPQRIAGESVAPSDLFESALSAGMAATLADAALRAGISVRGLNVEVTHVRDARTRQVKAVTFTVTYAKPLPAPLCRTLEKAARACPEKECLRKGIDVKILFRWGS